MDMGNLLQMGAKIFMDSQRSGSAGSGLDMGSLVSAISGLTGKGSEGDLDIGEMVGKLAGGAGNGDSNGMADMVGSWLGDGENQSIDAGGIKDLLGSDKISDFASKLGLSEDEAVGGLRDMIPQMVDKGSSGGSLLDSIGGIGGAINIASKIFGK